jgi:beta-glucosidase
MVDGATGVSSSAGTATAFPVPSGRGATFDPELEAKVGSAIGAEARARGADVLLAPVINILRHPAWGRAQETYGEDSYHLGIMGSAFIRGAQEQLIASAKHFAANSIEDRRFTVDVRMEERTLREVYLPHFKMAVDAGVGSIMSAYNEVNGQYCAENMHLLHDILKREWAFQGFVESDWVLGTRSTVASAMAGLDIEMPGAIYYGDELSKAVRSHQVPEDRIDDSVRRILRAEMRFGIYDGLPAVDPAVIESADHTRLALQAEREAIVLLKNEGAVLPLDRNRIRSIVVIGPLADAPNLGDSGGSSGVSPSYVVTPLAGIRAHAGAVQVDYVGTSSLSGDDLSRVGAADAAIVVVGLTVRDEGENNLRSGIGDRSTLALPAPQPDLVRTVAGAAKETIVVLEGSGAVTMEDWVDGARALVMAWYPGLEGGNAIAEVLFGETNPSGKLPVTFPKNEDQLPPFIHDQDQVEYGYFHGYRWVDHQGADPRFSFGFGLSYTTFVFTNMKLDATHISSNGRIHAGVDVTNQGTLEGDEVVQLYVGYMGSKVDRPVHQLVSFQRISLAPMETKTVGFDVAGGDLAYYDQDRGAWVVEPIVYTLSAGSSSRDLPVSASFAIDH